MQPCCDFPAAKRLAARAGSTSSDSGTKPVVSRASETGRPVASIAIGRSRRGAPDCQPSSAGSTAAESVAPPPARRCSVSRPAPTGPAPARSPGFQLDDGESLLKRPGCGGGKGQRAQQAERQGGVAESDHRTHSTTRGRQLRRGSGPRRGACPQREGKGRYRHRHRPSTSEKPFRLLDHDDVALSQASPPLKGRGEFISCHHALESGGQREHHRRIRDRGAPAPDPARSSAGYRPPSTW